MEESKDKLLQYIISGQILTDDELDQIIRDDPSFDRAEYQRLKEIWQLSDTLSQYQVPEQEGAWQKISHQTTNKGFKKKRVLFRWMSAATILILIGLFLFYHFEETTITHVASSDESYLLPDNSTVLLKSGSSITHKKFSLFNKDSLREIYLEGRGTFDILPEPRPFIANSELTKVEVLGTRFYYRAEDGVSEVENLEGKVRFSTKDGKKTFDLDPGDKSAYDGSEMTFTAQVVDTVSTIPSVDVPSVSITPTPLVSGEKPANNLSLSDLVRILKSRFPKELEWPAVKGGKFVVRLSLNQDLDGLIQDMLRNQSIIIEAIKTDNGYNITKLEAKNSGLQPDYTFEQFKNGVAPK